MTLISIYRKKYVMKAELSKKDQKYRELSLNGNMWKVILSVCAPLALYQSLNQLFTILDTMMASHISATSVSTVAYLSQVSQMLSALGGGIAVAAGIQISRAFGEGNYVLVKKRISTVYALCLAIGILILGVLFPFSKQFLRIAGAPEDLIAEGTAYFRVQLVILIVNFLNNVYIAVERARGNSKRILYINMTVIVTKLSLTAFFVYVLKGNLVMIAYASLISNMLLLVLAIRNSSLKDNAFGFSAKAITKEKQVMLPILNSAYPIVAEKLLFAFGKTVINSMCTVYGSLMVGAMGVSNNIGGITTNPQNGFQEGSAAVISQNFGAKKYKRVIDAFWVTMAINVALSIIIITIVVLNLDKVAGLFDSNDPEFHRLIMKVYKYEAYGAVPLGINATVMALLYGLNKTKITMIIHVSRVFVFRIPVFYFLQHFTNVGEASVGMVMMISNVSVAAMAVIVAAIVLIRYKKQYLTRENNNPTSDEITADETVNNEQKV